MKSTSYPCNSESSEYQSLEYQKYKMQLEKEEQQTDYSTPAMTPEASGKLSFTYQK